MFRRKEEGLFDSESTDAQEGAANNSGSTSNAGAAGSATSGNAASGNAAPLAATSSSIPSTSAAPATPMANNPSSLSAPSAAAASPSSFNNGSGNNVAAGNNSLARPMSDSRPGSVPTASAFRPNAQPLPGDMTRNRMPENKPALPASINPSLGSVTGAEKSKNSGRRVLTVGNDILLKGEIATCDRLVIEGKVDATLNDVHTVEIAESGSFKGSASIEDAEISGLFEGDLVVRNRLVIYGTGKVRGKITYGEIEIERGGELMGEIKTINDESFSQNRTTRTAQKEDKFAA